MHALLITALIGTQVTQIGSFLVGQRSDPITDVVQSLALLTDGDQSLAVGCNRENEGRISLFFPYERLPADVTTRPAQSDDDRSLRQAKAHGPTLGFRPARRRDRR